MSTTANDNRDPATLEREVDARRANLNRTLDAVENRFSPNHLMEQTVEYFGEHGGDIANSVSRSIKDNPLPILLAGVGIAWLISSQSSSRIRYTSERYRDPASQWDDQRYRTNQAQGAYAQASRPKGSYASASGRYASSNTLANSYSGSGSSDDGSMLDSARESLQDWAGTAAEWKDEMSRRLSSTKQDATESAEDFRQRVIDTSAEHAGNMEQRYRQTRQQLVGRGREQAESAKNWMQDLADTAAEWKDEMSRRLQSMKQEAGESAEDFRQRVIDSSATHAENMEYNYRQTRQQLVDNSREYASSVRNWMHEQPLVAGALGVAAGALIGTLLPSSKMEDRLVGEQADDIKSQLARRAESVSGDVASTLSDSAQKLREKGEQKLDAVKSDDTRSSRV